MALSFKKIDREQVKVNKTQLIETSVHDEESNFLLIVKPKDVAVNLAGWANLNREWIEENLLKYGAVLFRGFQCNEPKDFEEFCKNTSNQMIEYNERAAPRQNITQKVYTSTEYPANQSIPMHHEMSYSHNFPSKIWFYCVQPAKSGGATPIANDRKVISKIPPRIKELFLEKKIMYVRNYSERLDLKWQEVFQTEDKKIVEEYCRNSKMSWEWLPDEKLRTKAIRQVLMQHPVTKETVWFNHAHMFHHSNIEPETRRLLLSTYKENELPRNAFWGDESSIPEDVLEEIRAIYEECSVRFEWQKNDILMVDNFLVSHGRDPFEKPRQILVAMADLYVNPEI